jgi:hypothetical protein
MPSAGFEPANPATKQPQTYALDRAGDYIGDIKNAHKILVGETCTEWTTSRTQSVTLTVSVS